MNRSINNQLLTYVSNRRLLNSRALLVFSTMLLAFSLWARPVEQTNNSATAASEANSCQLTMVWGSWPPYQYLSLNGEVEGLQIELIQQIAKLAGCQLKFKLQSFRDNVASIKAGDADIMADITPTRQRAQFARFSVPYRQENMVLYVRKEFEPVCKSRTVGDLLNGSFRLGLTEGNWYGDEVNELVANPHNQHFLHYLKTNDLGAEYLFNNQIDGFFEDPLVMAYKIRQRKQSQHIASCRIVVSGGPVSLMFSKKTVSSALVERFNRAIEKVKQTTEYKKRWSWDS